MISTTTTTTSQAMLNHHQQLGLFEDHDQDQDQDQDQHKDQDDQFMSTQLGFYSLPPNNNLALPPLLASQALKTFTILPSTNNLHETLLLSSSDHFGGPHLSLQRSSTANLWAWGQGVNNGCLLGNGIDHKRSGGGDEYYVGLGDENKKVGVSTMKMKVRKIKASNNIRRKVREPRFCFKTMTEVDVLNDGYKWRKYGQKVVKNTHHPRSYYRCTQDSCRVKKRVERFAEDPRMVITTYEGRHAHSPSHDLDHSPPHDLTNFFC